MKDLVPDGDERAIVELNGGGIAQIGGGAIGGDQDGLGPGATVVFAEAGLIAEGGAAVTVGQEKTISAEPKQVGGQPPNADGVGDAPAVSGVGGFGLEGFVVVGRVMVSELEDDAMVSGFDRMEFVVMLGVVTGADGDLSQPLPGLAVVGRLADTDAALAGPEFLSGVEESSGGELDGAVGAVDDAGVTGGPGDAVVG